MSRQLRRAKKTKGVSKSRLNFGLPHGPSFTFVTELVASAPGISAECITIFRDSDPIFAGHFPGNPLVPGVIITEALAQTAGIAAGLGIPRRHDHFFPSAIRNMNSSTPSGRNNALFYAPTKSRNWGNCCSLES